jgi:arylsulfatase A-like enzyme
MKKLSLFLMPFSNRIKSFPIGLTVLFSFTAIGKSPNFVLVYIDDLGWAETSVEMIEGREDTRSDFNRTPNLERLAREGMVLSSCYSPSALCAPSRNSLLHGMTPSRLRYTVLSAVEARKQYLGQITIPQALKKANSRLPDSSFWQVAQREY